MANADDTVTVGQARDMISATVRTVSVQTVRRLVERGALRSHWTRTSPALYTRSEAGQTLRGHRRIVLASVLDYIEAEQAKIAAQKKPKES